MRFCCACLLPVVAVFAYSQAASKPTETSHSRPTITDFGLVYPLSNDWIRATELLRKKLAAENSLQNFDVLLAAVYVPSSDISPSSPFFSLLAYRQQGADCRKSLEAVKAHSQDKKEKPVGDVVEFSSAGREYFRLNMAHGFLGRHQCMICSTAKGHLLVWNAGAFNEKGLEAIVSTLTSITPLAPASVLETPPPSSQKEDDADGSAQPGDAKPQTVRIASGLTQGLRIKNVAPGYPEDARKARIQGTVLLKAQISKQGDIVHLELLDGPIELAGSAVAAVRQWKYKPYLLAGEPVTVETQIQVNYALH